MELLRSGAPGFVFRRIFGEHKSGLVFRFVFDISVQFDLNLLSLKIRIKRRQAGNRFLRKLKILRIEFQSNGLITNRLGGGDG